MARRTTPRRFVFPALALALLAATFLPHDTRAYQAITQPLNRVADALLAPVSSQLRALGGLARASGEPDRRYAELTTARDRIDYLESQYLALLQENRQLRRENAELQRLNEYVGRFQHHAIRASVTAVQADSRGRMLTLNRGRRAGLTEALAVVKGGDLVGRLVNVGRLTAQVELLTSPGVRLIEGVLLPANPDGTPSEQRRRTVALEPSGPDELSGLVYEDHPVAAGDRFRLADETWPQAAQMMVVGEVVEVEQVFEPPQRKRVVVRSRRRPLLQMQDVYVLTPGSDESTLEIPPE